MPAELVNTLGERRKRDLAAWSEWAERNRPDHIFYVDIVGTCNLRCPSCAVGNSVTLRPGRLMSLETFTAILDKARREHEGERVDVELYIWGEPVLHKGLPEFIKAAKARGMSVGISCNMNVFPAMREVVKAEPTFLRISLSGYTNATYQVAHAGGDINAVKANMHMLRHHLDTVGGETLVQVFYHVYRYNLGEEMASIRRLCAELEFLFEAFVATLRPVEKAIAAMQGHVAPADQAIVDQLAVPMPEISRLASSLRSAHPHCLAHSISTHIDTDGSVRLCGVAYEERQKVAASYLETPRKELLERRLAHPLCKTCQAVGADLALLGPAAPQIHTAAVATLGAEWEDYLSGR